MKFKQFIVTVAQPPSVRTGELAEYISVAVRQWSRGGDSEDPKWSIGDYEVRVRSTDLGTPIKVR